LRFFKSVLGIFELVLGIFELMLGIFEVVLGVSDRSISGYTLAIHWLYAELCLALYSQ
jgi:hypothetical protein